MALDAIGNDELLVAVLYYMVAWMTAKCENTDLGYYEEIAIANVAANYPGIDIFAIRNYVIGKKEEQ